MLPAFVFYVPGRPGLCQSLVCPGTVMSYLVLAFCKKSVCK